MLGLTSIFRSDLNSFLGTFLNSYQAVEIAKGTRLVVSVLRLMYTIIFQYNR